MKKITVFLVCIMAATLLISAALYASEMVSGVAKSFDAKSGKLVLQTATQKEATFSIPQTVRVYIGGKGKDTEVADAWQFLQHNLGHGTKVQILHLGGEVQTIWILEVPR